MVFDTLKSSFEAWKKMYLSPKAAIAAECKRKAGIMEGASHLFWSTTVLFAIFAVLFTLMLMLVGAGSSGAAGAAFAGLAAGMMVLLLLVYYALFLLSNVLGSFSINGLYYIIANKLGGKGTYERQFYVMSVEYAATVAFLVVPVLLFFILSFLAMAIRSAPVFAVLIFAPFVIYFIYDAYLKVRTLAAVHGFGAWRALVTWGIPAIFFILAVLLYILLLASLGVYGLGKMMY